MSLKRHPQPPARMLWMGNKGRAYLVIRTGQKRWHLSLPHRTGIEIKTPILCLSAFLTQKPKPTDQYQCGRCMGTYLVSDLGQHDCKPDVQGTGPFGI